MLCSTVKQQATSTALISSTEIQLQCPARILRTNWNSLHRNLLRCPVRNGHIRAERFSSACSPKKMHLGFRTRLRTKSARPTWGVGGHDAPTEMPLEPPRNTQHHRKPQPITRIKRKALHFAVASNSLSLANLLSFKCELPIYVTFTAVHGMQEHRMFYDGKRIRILQNHIVQCDGQVIGILVRRCYDQQQ